MSPVNALPPISPNFQYVPVPNERVTAVMRFVASLDSVGEGNLASVTTGVQERTNPLAELVQGWSDDEIRHLTSRSNPTSELLRDTFDALAPVDGPAEPMSTNELAAATGQPIGKLRNMPTQLTRALKAFDGDKASPFFHQWGEGMLPAREAQMYFSVTPERAEQWHCVKGR